MKTAPARGLAVAFIGMGKVGTTLACHLHAAGYSIAAVHDISRAAMRLAAERTGARPCTKATAAARLADVVFLTTPDDAIEDVCRMLAEKRALCRGKSVFHVSGACGLDLLDAARRCGASVGCIHPLQSFPDFDSAFRTLPGSTFGLTVEDDLKDWATDLVSALRGVPLFISDSDKPLYHAAACIASNYLVTLINAVQRLYQSFGLTDDKAMKAFWPLILGTLRNIEHQGAVSSLTGPIERGDVGTVKRHLSALSRRCPNLLSLYRNLGILTVDVAERKNNGSSADRLKLIREILGRRNVS